MSYQLGYDPQAMAAYLDASGQDANAVDMNGMTVGGAPAANSLTVGTHGSYGFSVGSTGTAFCVVLLCVGAYVLLHMDRVRLPG